MRNGRKKVNPMSTMKPRSTNRLMRNNINELVIDMSVSRNATSSTGCFAPATSTHTVKPTLFPDSYKCTCHCKKHVGFGFGV